MKKRIATFLNLTLFFALSSLTTYSQNIQLVQPAENEEFTLPAPINMLAEVDGVIPGQPIHLKVISNQTGYRKLKIGNNPTSLYSPKINVIGAGNDKVEITLQDFSGTVNWSKIRFRPQAQGSLNVAPYVDVAGGATDGWVKITIPLEDFDATIDFTNIAYIEFPYSANAPFFEMGISEIKFTGGPVPILWFGNEKNDNIQNGNGGPGELIATLEPATPAISNVTNIAFYETSNLLGETIDYPFAFSWQPN
nr:hypothetical protein [Bacteroidota bacterium]